MQWTSQQLRAFQAVAETGTMTAAARTLGYTTGAVSQQITNLEQNIGQALFTRLPRRLVLTDIGEVFLYESKRILESYSRASRALESFTPDHEVSIQLGVFTSVAVAYLPDVLERLRLESPHIHVHMQEIGIASVGEALMRGTLDLALSVNYPNIPMPVASGVLTETLHTEEFSLVTGSTEPLSLEGLKSSDWILPPDDSYFGKSVRLALHNLGIRPKVRHVLENHVASVAMAKAGYGVTPVTATTLALSNTQDMSQPFPGKPRRDIVVIATGQSMTRPSVVTIKSAIQAVIQDAGGVGEYSHQ